MNVNECINNECAYSMLLHQYNRYWLTRLLIRQKEKIALKITALVWLGLHTSYFTIYSRRRSALLCVECVRVGKVPNKLGDDKNGKIPGSGVDMFRRWPIRMWIHVYQKELQGKLQVRMGYYRSLYQECLYLFQE